MQVMFSKCDEAIEYATSSRKYGCFYSEKASESIDIHLHECCEIMFCLSGGKNMFIGERIYEAEDGDIFVINPFEAHKITSAAGKPFVRFVMQINPAFLYASSTAETDLACCFSMRGDNISHKIATRGEETEKMFHIMRKFFASCSYGDDVMKNLAAVEFITTVNKLFAENNRGYTYHSENTNKTLSKAISYINENFSDDLSLETIAKNCFVSVNGLCRMFKQHTGTTVGKYIVSRRMTEAKKLLKNGMNVTDAAEICGFSDYTGFIRAFKKAVGVSPGKYKRQFNQKRG